MHKCPKCGATFIGDLCPNNCVEFSDVDDTPVINVATARDPAVQTGEESRTVDNKKARGKSGVLLAKKIIKISVAAAVALVGLYLFSTLALPKMTAYVQSIDSKKPVVRESYVLNTPASIDGFNVTALSIKELKEGVTKEEGFKYVSIAVEFENTSGNDNYVNPDNFTLYADDYKIESTTYLPNGKLEGQEIAQGTKYKGNLYYRVPEECTNFKLHYTTGWQIFTQRVIFTMSLPNN